MFVSPQERNRVGVALRAQQDEQHDDVSKENPLRSLGMHLTHLRIAA